MIGKVRKYLFWGVKDQVDLFLDQAQHKGVIEFISKEKSKREKLPPEVQEVFSTIKILKQQPVGETEPEKPKKPPQLVKENVLQSQASLDQLYEERRRLFSEISHILPFGDFSKEDLDYVANEGKRIIQFFCMRTSKEKKEPPHPELIYIDTEYDLDYYFSISKEHLQIPKMIEIAIDKPVGELRKRLQDVKKEIATLEKHLKTLISYIEPLKRELINQLNVHHLEHTKDLMVYPMDDEGFFVAEAWIPERKKKQVDELVKDLNITYERIEEDNTDRVPTYMENKKASKVGEDLVNIYDVPSTEDKDPSLWVLIAFAIFFAMIISDAGYGLLYLLLGFFCVWKTRSPKPKVKRFIQLVFMLAVTTTIWGTVTGTFFGVNFDPKSAINKVNMLQVIAEKKASYHLEKKDETFDYWQKKYPEIKTAKTGEEMIVKGVSTVEGKTKYEILSSFQDSVLMELSILAGIIHLSLSFIRYLKRSWAGIGWCFFLVGGYLFFPFILGATSLVVYTGIFSKDVAHTYGMQLIYAGFAWVMLFSVIQKGIKGVTEIVNVIQVFADVLSYLRLYALALASVILASTFNDMGQSLGFVVGGIVIVIGHMVNILLGIMGGVIHGLRLNFIEWYHYSFEGDGKLFRPLKLLK